MQDYMGALLGQFSNVWGNTQNPGQIVLLNENITQFYQKYLVHRYRLYTRVGWRQDKPLSVVLSEGELQFYSLRYKVGPPASRPPYYA